MFVNMNLMATSKCWLQLSTLVPHTHTQPRSRPWGHTHWLAYTMLLSWLNAFDHIRAIIGAVFDWQTALIVLLSACLSVHSHSVYTMSYMHMQYALMISAHCFADILSNWLIIVVCHINAQCTSYRVLYSATDKWYYYSMLYTCT